MVGPSKIGGRNRCRRRSPASNELPSSSQIMRSIGSARSGSRAARSVLKKLVTTVALGARSRKSAMLPMWSPSSWDRKTQRTSSGSTTVDTASSHCSRCNGAPVSTTTGSSARITKLFTYRYESGPLGTRLGINQVSSAMRCGSTRGGAHGGDGVTGGHRCSSWIGCDDPGVSQRSCAALAPPTADAIKRASSG